MYIANIGEKNFGENSSQVIEEFGRQHRASMSKGTSSVNLVLPQIFCATFPLRQVSATVFLPSLSLRLLDPIVLPRVL